MTNDLTETGNPPQSKAAISSPKLRDDLQNFDRIRRSAGMSGSDMPTPPESSRSSLMADANMLERSLVPSPSHSVAMVLSRLSNALPSATNSKLTKQESEQRFLDYVDALQEMPEDLLEIARSRVMRTATFFVTPAELYAAVKTEIDERRDMLAAARHMIWKMDREL